MNVKSILKRGKGHPDFCQDALFHYEDDDILVACVCDGCSEFKDSHFASNLFVKVLKKTLKECLEKEILRADSISQAGYADDEFGYNTDELTEIILFSFFKKIKSIQLELDLSSKDLAATFSFFLYNKKTDEGVIYVFGDGVLQINDDTIIIDHNNEPRYFYLYWDELTTGLINFMTFIKSYQQKWQFKNLQNIVISTDGVLSFQNKDINPDEARDFLIIDDKINEKSIISQNSFYDKKYNKLHSEGWTHYDDLGIIRIVK